MFRHYERMHWRGRGAAKRGDSASAVAALGAEWCAYARMRGLHARYHRLTGHIYATGNAPERERMRVRSLPPYLRGAG